MATANAQRILPPGAHENGRVAPTLSLAPLAPSEISPIGRHGLPRVGRNRALPRPALQGSWLLNRAGQSYWISAVRSQGAQGVRLHFRNFDAGSDQVWIHDGDPVNGQVFGPYSGHGTFGDGDFWTEMIFQDTVYIEYLRRDAHAGPPPRFAVPELFHLWQDLGSRDASDVGCFLDEPCYTGTPFVPTFSNGVALMIFADHSCSGTLLADRNNTGTPYFLSAGHCIADQSEARSMVTVFSYRDSGCNGTAGPLSADPQVSGADLLARNVHEDAAGNLQIDAPDFSFTRLTAFPKSGAALPWLSTAAGPDRLTSLSHPRNLPQKFASGTIIDSSSPYFYMVRMSQGAVDHGSSGSGLINSSGQIVGLSSFVPNDESVSACDINIRDYGYTRFDAIYPAVKQWLEAPALAQAVITSPANGSRLPGSSATFTWSSPPGATGYALSIGSQAGGSDLFAQDFGTATTGTVTGLPVDGSILYVRLTTRSAPGTAHTDYTYVAYESVVPTGPVVTRMSSAASTSATIAPAGLVSAYGQNLGPAAAVTLPSGGATGSALPLNLGGTSVTVDGMPAAILHASYTRIDFQAPDDPTIGLVPVVITTPAGSAVPVSMTILPIALQLYSSPVKSSAGTYVAATHADGSAVLPASLQAGASPANPNETITVTGTGCGPTVPPNPSGQVISPAPLANPVTATVGGLSASVSAGLASAGLCQFSLTVPSAGAGDQPFSIAIAGSRSQPLILPMAGLVAAGNTVWQGSAADTSTSYGGPPYCNYSVTMSNLQLSASPDASLQTASVVLTGTMTATATDGCPYPPVPQNNHFYTGVAALNGNSLTVQLSPAITNQPQAVANFNGQVVSGRLAGSLTITYTDPIAPLSWTVSSQVQ